MGGTNNTICARRTRLAAEEELHRHIDLCSPCRALYEHLLAEEKVIVRAFAAMGAPMREASLSPKSAIGGQRPEGTHALGTIGKIAAAIVIAGGIIGLAIGLLKLGSATPAFADIAGPILKSTTCTFKVTTEIKDANGPGVGHAMFAAPGRMRVEYGDGEPDVHITDFERQRMLMLMPAKGWQCYANSRICRLRKLMRSGTPACSACGKP